MIRDFAPTKIYEALDYTMKYYPDKYSEEAKAEIEMLLDHCIDGLQDDSEKFLSTLVIKALRHLIGPSNINEHIYLKKYEITQIELFKILIDEFPFVKYGHGVANAQISNLLKGKTEGIILDIGMGQGIQMLNLIKRLKGNKDLKNLTIIGIEPFGEALDKAKEMFSEISKTVHFKIELVPWQIFVQDITEQNISNKLNGYRGEVIVNASLALHHIETSEQRNKVLSVLRSITPKGIILIEPNSDHYEADFHTRFRNCYNHFYHVFQVIDNLKIDKQAKSGLKLFFGREIEDIIGKANEERFEKHEFATQWVNRLVKSGYVMKSNFLKELPQVNSGISLKYANEGYLGFNYKEETILSVIYAESV